MSIKVLLSHPGILSVVPVSVPSAITVDGQPSVGNAATAGGGSGSTVVVAVTVAVSCSVLAAAAVALWLLRRARKASADVGCDSEYVSKKAAGTTAAV